MGITQEMQGKYRYRFMSLKSNMNYFTAYDLLTGEVLGVGGGIGATKPIDTDLVKHIVGAYPSDTYFVNQSGEPTAYLPEQIDAKKSRPTFPAKWSNGQMCWMDVRSLILLKAGALKLIDNFAGEARLRYITSVPGQAETYAKKEQQAREWASSSFSGDPPPFIQAEATALGVDPVVLANEIIAMADYWATNKGPQIEACRRKWKVNVESAVEVSGIDGLTEAAKIELEAL